MNTRAKGRNAEKEFASILRKQGYLVDLVKGSTKFNKQVDFFGIGDILAINKESLLIVQVKSNTTSGAIKKLKEFKQSFDFPDFVKFQVVVRYDNKNEDRRWRVIDI